MNNAMTITQSNAVMNRMFSQDLYERWIQYIDVKEKSRQSYERAIRQFAEYLADSKISQPTREDVINFRELYKNGGTIHTGEYDSNGNEIVKVIKKHKASTVQAYIMAVRLFFAYLDQQGLYPNIADKIKGAKVTAEHKEDYLSVKQSASLLNSIDRSTLQGKRDYAIIWTMLTGGLRTVEVVRANIEDLSTLNDADVLYLQGKGKDERTAYIKIEENTKKAIQEYLTARGKAKGTEPLFISLANKNAGERLTTRSVSRLAKQHLINSGIDSARITAHSLRHTTAVTNLRSGATLEETQQLMRHSNINTTMIYLNSLSRESNNSEARVGSVIFGAI